MKTGAHCVTVPSLSSFSKSPSNFLSSLISSLSSRSPVQPHATTSSALTKVEPFRSSLRLFNHSIAYSAPFVPAAVRRTIRRSRHIVYYLPLAVGTPVTQRPPHRPGRAVFPHPVPRLYSLARRAKSSCKYPVLSLRLGDCRAGYSQTFQCSREHIPGKATLLPASPVEPFECTFFGPPIKAVKGPAILILAFAR